MKITEKTVETVSKKEEVLEISRSEFHEIVGKAAGKFVAELADNALEAMAFVKFSAMCCAMIEKALFEPEEEKKDDK